MPACWNRTEQRQRLVIQKPASATMERWMPPGLRASRPVTTVHKRWSNFRPSSIWPIVVLRCPTRCSGQRQRKLPRSTGIWRGRRRPRLSRLRDCVTPGSRYSPVLTIRAGPRASQPAIVDRALDTAPLPGFGVEETLCFSSTASTVDLL